MTGLRRMAWTVLEPITPLLRVTPAFAGQSPIGGRISNFSPVAPADPESGDTETLGSISGIVTGLESPLSGATVQLVQGETVVASTTTESDGSYAFSGLDLGSYLVVADAEGWQADSEAVVLTEENPDATDVNINLSPDVIIG